MLALKDRDMDQAEFKRMVHRATPPSGTTLEDVCKPEFWTNVAGRLKHCDHIEVLPEDMAWHATLIVIGKGQLHANVAVLNHVSLGAISNEVAGADYVVEWAGPKHLHRVKRSIDGAVVKTGIPTKQEALAHARSLEAVAA